MQYLKENLFLHCEIHLLEVIFAILKTSPKYSFADATFFFFCFVLFLFCSHFLHNKINATSCRIMLQLHLNRKREKKNRTSLLLNFWWQSKPRNFAGIPLLNKEKFKELLYADLIKTVHT